MTAVTNQLSPMDETSLHFVMQGIEPFPRSFRNPAQGVPLAFIPETFFHRVLRWIFCWFFVSRRLALFFGHFFNRHRKSVLTKLIETGSIDG